MKRSLVPVTPEEQIEACHWLLDQYEIPRKERVRWDVDDGAGITIYSLAGRIKLALENNTKIKE